MCKGPLKFEAIEKKRIELDEKESITGFDSTKTKEEEIFEDSVEEVVKEGVLICESCKVWYPISNYVPVMLVFRTQFHDFFAKKHHLELPNGYTFPKWSAKPGEKNIQETFTEEWNALQDDELSFAFTKDELVPLHRDVFLQWSNGIPVNVKEVLNVGCGFGAEADALSKIVKDADIYGIDLNFSLLNSGQLFTKKPSIHLIIASLFHLPFNKSSFDLVYCQGVLHHTYSTHDAFNSIAAFVKEGGYIFTWVYALEDHLIIKGIVGVFSKLKYIAQNILRPLFSRFPGHLRKITVFSISLVYHYIELSRSRHKEEWKLKNTFHSLYDLLTPRFAYRHSFNEVIEWYETLGLTYDLHSPATNRKLFGTHLYGIGVLGQRKKTESNESVMDSNTN